MPRAKAGADTTDYLQEIMQILADAMSAPDASRHMQVLQELQQAIAGYIAQSRQQVAQQATGMGRPGQPGGGPGAGQMPGMGPGGPPGGMGGGPPGGGMPPRQIAPGGGAGMSGFGTPNPDELRRTLAGPAAIGGRAF